MEIRPMRVIRCLCAAIMALLLASCALGDTPALTPHPPVTVVPPPTLTFSGDCRISSELSDWLQYSTFYVNQFTDVASAAAAKRPDAAYEDVIMLERLRDDFGRVAIPDCAEPVERLIMTAMSATLDGFEAYVNGDSASMDDVMRDALAQFDLVVAGQQGLSAQLEAQLRQQQSDQ